jgi:aspartyl-tRNA(Asn)/glutamyl-tRNA(Gln) amidotransferase subunit C
MALDPEAVRRIARLARLAVPESDLPGLAKELSGILNWVEQLEAIDTEGVEPMTSVVELTLPMRDDVVTDGGQAEKIVANAPAAVHGYFAVPKVVE